MTMEFAAFRFQNAESTRLKLIDLERSNSQDFPCVALIVDPAALGAAVGMDTIPARKLTRWLWLVEEGYLYCLAKSAAGERNSPERDYERLPTMEEYLRRHDMCDGKLLEFARRLSTLSEPERRACAVALHGAPPDSEKPEFSPSRRGFYRRIGLSIAEVDSCDSHTHAALIGLALEAIGPTARVETKSLSRGWSEFMFQPLWCLATETWMAYLWIGSGDPLVGLTTEYVGCCARLVRNEYDFWLWKAPATLSDDNPILHWLAVPNEPSRLAALTFAMRHAAAGNQYDSSNESKSTPSHDERLTQVESPGLEVTSIANVDDRKTPAQTTLSSADDDTPNEQAPALRPFQGGRMVFFDDRVELCGVDLCGGRRYERFRMVLELLRGRRRHGRFVSYSAQELAEAIGGRAGQNGAIGLIRSLRQHIRDALRIAAGFECRKDDVIRSGGPGYRLNEWICVDKVDTESADSQTRGDARRAGLEDSDGDTKIADDPDPCIPENWTEESRQAWIMRELAKGRQLRAPEMAEAMRCSLQTAKRDLKRLKRRGFVEFVGAPRNGHYRLASGVGD